jgi:hypothetical protein
MNLYNNLHFSKQTLVLEKFESHNNIFNDYQNPDNETLSSFRYYYKQIKVDFQCLIQFV